MTAKNLDEAKGRVKEATGVLTGDDGLKRAGRLDQARHTVKDAVDKVFDRIQNSRASKK